MCSRMLLLGHMNVCVYLRFKIIICKLFFCQNIRRLPVHCDSYLRYCNDFERQNHNVKKVRFLFYFSALQWKITNNLSKLY